MTKQNINWGRLAKVERNYNIHQDRKNGIKLNEIAKKYSLTKQRIVFICSMVERRIKRGL